MLYVLVHFFIKLVKLEELDLRQTLNPIRLNLSARLISNVYIGFSVSPCSLELISPAYQPCTVFFSQKQNNISRFISRKNHQPNNSKGNGDTDNLKQREHSKFHFLLFFQKRNRQFAFYVLGCGYNSLVVESLLIY
jgi:hypothetical protein